MSDLIKRLGASCYLAFEDGTNDYSAAQEAIDRIEALEKQCSVYARSDQFLVEEIKELEAKLAKAETLALETILNERGPVFDAMVDAAEDAAGKDVSFNVVVGRAIRAALAALAELEGK